MPQGGGPAIALSAQVERKHIVIGALKPEWILAASERGIQIATAGIAITDLNIQHTFRGTPHVRNVSTKGVARSPKAGALDLEWYKELPRHVLIPEAVLLDLTGKEPVFQLIFDVPGSNAEVVVELNTWVKKARGQLNLVVSGRLVSINDIITMIGRGIELVDGSL